MTNWSNAIIYNVVELQTEYQSQKDWRKFQGFDAIGCTQVCLSFKMHRKVESNGKSTKAQAISWKTFFSNNQFKLEKSYNQHLCKLTGQFHKLDKKHLTER